MDRDDVRLGEELVQGAIPAELGLHATTLRVEHAKLEPSRASRDSLTDPAQADDPERRPGQLLREKAVRP